MKERPEIVTHHIGSDMAAADRPANKGTDEIFGVVQHELIAGPGRDSRKGDKRIGARILTITRRITGLPRTAEKKRIDAADFPRAERISDMGFVHNGALHGAQAIINPLNARRTSWPCRGSQ